MKPARAASSVAARSIGVPLAMAADANDQSLHTTSPIKHVIVIIGENRSFDHVFATYEPKKGQKVWNLLSEGIIKGDGTPGPNLAARLQRQTCDPADSFRLRFGTLRVGGDNGRRRGQRPRTARQLQHRVFADRDDHR